MAEGDFPKTAGNTDLNGGTSKWGTSYLIEANTNTKSNNLELD
jgi:hypothetical protein